MKIKSFVTISLFIFWAVVTAILVAGLVFYQNNRNTLTDNNIKHLVADQSDGTKYASQITLDLAEVAKHNLASDCWTIVHKKVYNLTSFAILHSGGASEIIKDCGKDGTAGYDTKYGKGSHRSGDVNILANYYVGDLGQTASQQVIQQNIQKSNTAPSQNFSERENEDEYELEDD